MENATLYNELWVDRGQGRVYVRDYAGKGPAFVLMHGFPDNLHIYDDLVPFLTKAGRRVVTFDFLGFGRSDKPADGSYSFSQQLGDVVAVRDALALDRIVPVAHDSSGPAVLNFALAHPQAVAELCILNSGYDDAQPILWPEMIQLFATRDLSALARAVASSTDQFKWLLDWQRQKFCDPLPPPLQEKFVKVMGPLIAANFTQQPSSARAFMMTAAEFYDELARNRLRLSELGALEMPVKVIWGKFDPYITVEVARARAALFRNAQLTILPAGHWLQSDLPADVAAALLA